MRTVSERRNVIKDITFDEINHEDNISRFKALKLIKSESINKFKTTSSFYLLIISSLSSNKFKFLSGWIKCFKIIGNYIFVCYLLLFIKNYLTFIELSLYKLKFLNMLNNVTNIFINNNSQSNN